MHLAGRQGICGTVHRLQLRHARRLLPHVCVVGANGGDQHSPKQNTTDATDEQLLRELNSSHLWLPDEDSEFGLEDIAAHVNSSRDRGQLLDVKQSSRQKGRKSGPKSSKHASAASTLAQVDADQLPGWIEDLRQEGFDVLGRNGQLFLQRGDVTQQQQQQQPSTSRGSKARPSAAAGVGQPAAGEGAVQQQSTAKPVSDKSLAIRLEFDPLVWKPQATAGSNGSSGSNSSSSPVMPAAAAWYGSTTGSVAPAAAADRSTQQTNAASSSGSLPKAAVRSNVRKQLLSFKHPDKLLHFVASCFPAWAANGFWLVDQQQPGVVCAPTPAEAAAALKGVAVAAKRAGLSPMQTQSLARDRVVVGLVECLRLTPPRTAPHQPPSLSQRLWAIAKAYWVQTGAAATAAQQQLLAAAAASSGSQHSGQAGSLSASRLAGTPVMGQLLAQLQSAGLSLNRQQLAAAQTLIQSRQQTQLVQQACAGAVWAMSVIGGPLFFQQEMEALCGIIAAGRWQFAVSDVCDMLWALANARHWSSVLPQLEAALLGAGGATAATSADLVTALWAFATLAHTPQRLLGQLEQLGWAVKDAAASFPPAERTKLQDSVPQTPRRQGQQQPQPQPDARSRGSSHQLSGLSSGQLTSLAWSLAVLQQVRGLLFRAVWQEVCTQAEALAAAGDVRELVRVQQAALAIRLEGGYDPAKVHNQQGTQQLLVTAARVFKDHSSSLQAKVHSTYQRSIASTLSKMQLMHVLEDNTTGYSVDITVPTLRVAIEADGPSHVSRTTRNSSSSSSKQRPVQLGATALKRRLLQGLGWHVVNVAYDQWDDLPDMDQKIRFLKNCINAAVADERRSKQISQQGS